VSHSPVCTKLLASLDVKPYTTAAHEAVRMKARRFAQALPRTPSGFERESAGAPDRDSERVAEQDVREAASALARAGLLRVCVSDEGPAKALELATVREELAAVSGLHDAVFAVQGLTAFPLQHATDEVRSRWMSALAQGSALGAFAVTEPHAGSDPASMRTRATRTGDSYVLTGHKTFISNVPFADLLLVFARSEPSAEGPPQFSVFAVSADLPGLSFAPQKLNSAHPIGAVTLNSVEVPLSARVGSEGAGLALCFSALERYRPTVAAAACGMARRAIDETVAHVSRRQQFSAPLCEQQSVRFQLADMATALHSVRLTTYHAAWALDGGDTDGAPAGRLASSMAKLAATERAQEIVDAAVQLHGARGLVRGTTIEQLYRHVRALRIYEGASEIQKIVIARELLKASQSDKHDKSSNSSKNNKSNQRDQNNSERDTVNASTSPDTQNARDAEETAS